MIVGREHQGGEDGNTRCCYGVLCDLYGKTLKVTAGQWTASEPESSHNVRAPPHHILVGRKHAGDENGPTAYLFGTVE
ncbi:hypothetical protein ACH4F6_36885 [Streptomyces sp. NPDC017936]|uniref:hypothetical protein n=1 Tax=Streptomyces sp. NPDC017936 TaxID=3365016 RepID=UPI00379A4BA8